MDPRLRRLTYQVAVGLGGSLAELTASGYKLRESGTEEDLLAVWAPELGSSITPSLAVGRHGTIRVSDGIGEPWQSPSVDDVVTVDLHGVAYVPYPDDFGLVVGDSGTVMVGTSRGTQWQRVDTPVTQGLNAVAIDGYGHATVVGNQGTILRTADRGASWEVLESPSTENLLSILVLGHVSDNYAMTGGYIVGASGTLLYSSDGMSWMGIETGVTEDLRQVIEHRETSYGPELPLILGETRLYTWKPDEPQLRLKSELHRPIYSVAEYQLVIRVLADRGEMLQFIEPFICERTRD